MSATTEQIYAGGPQGPARGGMAPGHAAPSPDARLALRHWLRGQAINVTRHAAALRPFRREEFGTGAAAPTEGHIQAVNNLVKGLRDVLLKKANALTSAVKRAAERPDTHSLQAVVTHKETAHELVRAVEKIWDFYFELFGQRQSRFGDWLVSCDRIALDCFQVCFLGVDIAKPLPAPPPFAYMRTGFSPATYRRGIPLRRLGRQMNPFPLIQIPYHRLVNPWTLGAILHEVSHNTQNDLGLAEVVPRRIGLRLLQAGHGRAVASVWVRWNREIFADLSGLLLGGPAVVASLMDVIGRSPETVWAYNPRGPHPTPYLRAFISFELLRRMGFADEAAAAHRAWTRCYPHTGSTNLPRPVLDTFDDAHRRVVEAICFEPYATLGDKSLAQVIPYGHKEWAMTEEAARRLAAGTDPGIIPERFLIGAARIAFDRRHARPEVIKENFYRELARR